MTFRGEQIYWMDTAGGVPPGADTLPATVDVAIVGAGYTGLTAALHLARAGRSVAVFDAKVPGFGASTRNGGMVGPGLHKLGITGLTRTYGEDRAIAILGEGLKALSHLAAIIHEASVFGAGRLFPAPSVSEE
jgi:glycine/D-amino acid oxidase-like deaminating enzyme